MKYATFFVLAIVLCCAGFVQASTYNWTWSDYANDPNGTWLDAANWSGGVVPTSTDVVHIGWVGVTHVGQYGSTVLTLTSNTTVAEVDIGTNNQYCDYDLYSTGSGAPYALNVTGNFSFDGTWMADYIQPVLNIGGTFTVGSTGYWDWRPSVKLGSSSGYTNGDTFAGGISQYCGYTLDASGNNETFGGKLMSQGFVPSMGEWDYHGSILGYIKIGGTGETFNAGTSFDLEYGGTIWLSTAQTLTNVSTITFNGGALRLDAANTFATLSGGFDVANGSILQIANDTSLGSDTNAITLGGAYSFGYLAGYASNSAGNYITRPITLAGNGGYFAIWSQYTAPTT